MKGLNRKQFDYSGNDFNTNMGKYKYLLFSFALLIGSTVCAQTGIGSCKSGFKKDGNTLFFSNTNGDVKIEFCSPTTFRVRSSWSRKFVEDEHLMQENYRWPAVSYKVTAAKSAYVIETSSLIVTVLKSPFKISVASRDGKVLSTEYTAGGLSHHGDTVACTKDLMPD